MLSFVMTSFYKFLSSFFGLGRDEKPHQALLILWINLNIGSDIRSFNVLKHILFPWLYAKCAGIHHAYICHLVYWHRRAIIIYHDTIDYLGACFTGTNFNQLGF